jgi:hypothetical protein
MSDNVIWAVFPQHNARRREEEALAHLASDIWTQLHAPGIVWKDDPSNWFYNSSPSDMQPPEAS